MSFFLGKGRWETWVDCFFFFQIWMSQQCWSCATSLEQWQQSCIWYCRFETTSKIKHETEQNIREANNLWTKTNVLTATGAGKYEGEKVSKFLTTTEAPTVLVLWSKVYCAVCNLVCTPHTVYLHGGSSSDVVLSLFTPMASLVRQHWTPSSACLCHN